MAYIKQSKSHLRRVRSMQNSAYNPFNANSTVGPEDYYTIGQRALRALEFGSDIGSQISPEYDTEDSGEFIDVSTSFRHDAFDIAEQFGESVFEDRGITVVDPSKQATDDVEF